MAKGIIIPDSAKYDYRHSLAMWQAVSLLNGDSKPQLQGKRAVLLEEFTALTLAYLNLYGINGYEAFIIPAASTTFWDGTKVFRVVTVADVSGLATALAALEDSIVGKTSAYVTVATDKTINCTAGTFNVTLLTAVGNTGLVQDIKNSGTGVITVIPNGAETIDGFTGVTLRGTPFFDSVTVQSTGTGWVRI